MSSSSSTTRQAEKRIELLFSKFAAFYGHVWRSQFKDEAFLKFAKKEWQDALGEFSEGVFAKATLKCREFYKFPPTLPQMVQCCRQIKIETTFYVVEKKHRPASCIVRAGLQTTTFRQITRGTSCWF